MQLSHYTVGGIANRLTSGAVGVIVPLGATEQHGPHLPLGVDSIIAAALAEGVAEHLGGVGHVSVIAPVLPFGDSAHHISFPGSTSLRHEVLVGILHDLCDSFLHASFSWVALVTGHAGNCSAMREVAARHDPGSVISVDDWPSIRAAIHSVANTRLGLGADYVGTHAGHFETSIMLHLCPELVQLHLAEVGAIGDPKVLGARLRSEGMAAVSQNGVIGDPTNADAAAGYHYLDAMVRYNSLVIHERLAS